MVKVITTKKINKDHIRQIVLEFTQTALAHTLFLTPKERGEMTRVMVTQIRSFEKKYTPTQP